MGEIIIERLIKKKKQEKRAKTVERVDRPATTSEMLNQSAYM